MAEYGPLIVYMGFSLLLAASMFRVWAIWRVFAFSVAWQLLSPIRPFWLDGILLGVATIILEAAFGCLKLRQQGNSLEH